MPRSTIVHARPPRRIKRRLPAPVVVDRRRPPEHDPAECVAAAEWLQGQVAARVAPAAAVVRGVAYPASMPDPILLANYRAAWDALALIREAAEELAPPGSVIASEQLGPDPMQEAEALVRGIWAIAGRCAVSAGSAEDSVTQPSVSNDIRPNASTS